MPLPVLIAGIIAIGKFLFSGTGAFLLTLGFTAYNLLNPPKVRQDGFKNSTFQDLGYNPVGRNVCLPLVIGRQIVYPPLCAIGKTWNAQRIKGVVDVAEGDDKAGRMYVTIYYAKAAWALCEGKITGVDGVWLNDFDMADYEVEPGPGELFPADGIPDDESGWYVVPGTATQERAAEIVEADYARSVPFRSTALLIFSGELGQMNRLPTVAAEVVADVEQIYEKSGAVDSGVAGEVLGDWFGYDEETGYFWAVVGTGSSRTKKGLVMFNRFGGAPTYTDPPATMGDRADFALYWGYADAVLMVSDAMSGRRLFASGRSGYTETSDWTLIEGPALSAETIGAWAFDPYEGVLFLYFTTSHKILAWDIEAGVFSELDVSAQIANLSAFAGLFFDHEYKRLAVAYIDTGEYLQHVDIEIEESDGTWTVAGTTTTDLNPLILWGIAGASLAPKGIGRLGEVWQIFDTTSRTQLLYTTSDEANVAVGPVADYQFTAGAGTKDATDLLTRAQILAGTTDASEPYLNAPTDAWFDHRSGYLWIRDTTVEGTWIFAYTRFGAEDFSFLGVAGYRLRIFTREGSPAGAVWLLKNHERLGEGIHEYWLDLRSFEAAEGWYSELVQVGTGAFAFFECRFRVDQLIDSLDDSSTYVEEACSGCASRVMEFDGKLMLYVRRPARRYLCTITDDDLIEGDLAYSYRSLTSRPANVVRVEFLNREGESDLALPWRSDVVEAEWPQDADLVRGTRTVQTVRTRATIDRSVAYRIARQSLMSDHFEKLTVEFQASGLLQMAAPGDHFLLNLASIPNCTNKAMRIEEIPDSGGTLRVVAMEHVDDTCRNTMRQQQTDVYPQTLGDYGAYEDAGSDGFTQAFTPWPARAIAIDRPGEGRGVVQFLYSRGVYDRHLLDISIESSDGRDTSGFVRFTPSAHLHEPIDETATTIKISMGSLMHDGSRGETFVAGASGYLWIASYADGLVGSKVVRAISDVEAVYYDNFTTEEVDGETIGVFESCVRGKLGTKAVEHAPATVSVSMRKIEDTTVSPPFVDNYKRMWGQGDKRTGENNASYLYVGANYRFNEIEIPAIYREDPLYRIHINQFEYSTEDGVGDTVWKRGVGLCDETEDCINLPASGGERRIITFEAGRDWKSVDVDGEGLYWIRFEKTVQIPHTRHDYGEEQIPWCGATGDRWILRQCPIVYKWVDNPSCWAYPREAYRQSLEFAVHGISRSCRRSDEDATPILALGVAIEFGDTSTYSGDMEVSDDGTNTRYPTKGDPLYVDSVGNLVVLDSENQTAVSGFMGFASQAMVSGEVAAGKVEVGGTIHNADWSWTPGAKVYADFTAKELTQSIPSGPHAVVGFATGATEIQASPLGDLGSSGAMTWDFEVLTSDSGDQTPHYPLSHKAAEKPIFVFVGGVLQRQGTGDPAAIDSTVYGFVMDGDRRGLTLTWKPDPDTGVLSIYMVEEV
jgi:hypothetical protein